MRLPIHQPGGTRVRSTDPRAVSQAPTSALKPGSRACPGEGSLHPNRALILPVKGPFSRTSWPRPARLQAGRGLDGSARLWGGHLQYEGWSLPLALLPLVHAQPTPAQSSRDAPCEQGCSPLSRHTRPSPASVRCLFSGCCEPGCGHDGLALNIQGPGSAVRGSSPKLARWLDHTAAPPAGGSATYLSSRGTPLRLVRPSSPAPVLLQT